MSFPNLHISFRWRDDSVFIQSLINFLSVLFPLKSTDQTIDYNLNFNLWCYFELLVCYLIPVLNSLAYLFFPLLFLLLPPPPPPTIVCLRIMLAASTMVWIQGFIFKYKLLNITSLGTICSHIEYEAQREFIIVHFSITLDF